MKEASFYQKLEKGKVKCVLCPHQCSIAEGKTGICGVRSNRKGALVSETFGRILACNLDPIEKKPLYHFHPGRQILSIGTRGCSFRCDFCQNWQMVVSKSPGTSVNSDEISAMAGGNGSIGIAYTYNEPLIWYEFVLECAEKVHEEGLKNVLVTNGFINPEPLEELLPFIDAMNIDLKSMDPGFYKTIVKGDLGPVLDTCRTANRSCHIEITNLLVPTLNDSDELIMELVDFVAGLGKDTPLHFSAYFPCRKMQIEPTPIGTLRRAYDIAREKLDYVYLGNVRDSDAGSSYCPDCSLLLVERDGYETRIKGMKGNRCAGCGKPLPFIV
ncbi:MAG: AmmeMemoRadiSam system radical SAM enzyme [Actinobacteria bacterium]|nr:AmmeMemoRadiSam system radical SAM enzyme [Actinomycetota bacterium]